MTAFEPNLAEGHALVFEGQKITFIRHLGDQMLQILDEKGKLFKVIDYNGQEVMPTWFWMISTFNEGTLIDPGALNFTDNERLKLHLQMDMHACAQCDRKAPWRWTWARTALVEGMPRSEAGQNWIDAVPIPGIPHQMLGNVDVAAQFTIRPKWRALVMWMKKYELYDGRIGAFVNRSGRPDGFSQLTPGDKAFLQAGADKYWETKKVVNKTAAAALPTRWRQLHAAEGGTGLGEKAPSRQAMCYQINKLENADNVKRREGTWKSDKFFKGNEEPVPVTRPFERIFIDGTQNSQVCVYSDTFKIKSPQMKSVHAMCAYTRWLFPFPTFTGPYRSQMGIQALLNVFQAPKLTEEELEAEPWRALVFGIPDLVMYDNDKAQLPPNLVPSLSVLSTTELAEPYHSDAKAKLERYFRFEKEFLSGIGGTVKGPEFLTDPRYDPLEDAELTRAQFADKKNEARLEWNAKPRRKFGWRSADDLMREYLEARL